MNNNNITIFGETNFRNQRIRFGIKKDDRRRHMYLVGKTGMGKTTMLENMMISDIQRGNGVAIIDPHGDFAQRMLDYIPSNRINDVVYFNPADIEHPIAFNVLESVNPQYKHLVASGLVSVYKKIWADSWGPRLEYVLRNTILALLDYHTSTMLGITRMLVNKSYRKRIVGSIKDPVVKQFWVDEFPQYHSEFRTEAISPIQNKVGQFLSSAIIRNIVGQPKSAIDMRDIMDNKKILLVNLAKGKLGEDIAALLGAMIITKIQLAAMGRADIPEEKRQDFYLYVDEFQNFATESFADILSEARKYRLDLTLAHQYLEQLDEKVKAAIFGNMGTIICFRVGAADAEELVKEFEPVFDENDLVNLTKYEIYVKLMIDGVAENAFSSLTLPPPGEELKTGNREKVIEVSREHYTRPRKVIEEKIVRWSGMEELNEQVEQGENSREFSHPSKSVSRGSYSRQQQSGNVTKKKFSPPFVKPNPNHQKNPRNNKFNRFYEQENDENVQNVKQAIDTKQTKNVRGVAEDKKNQSNFKKESPKHLAGQAREKIFQETKESRERPSVKENREESSREKKEIKPGEVVKF